MENYKHFEMKDKYREETNTDVYADEDVLTRKPTGSFSNKYVSWLEKIAWEGMNANSEEANCAIFDVSVSLPELKKKLLSMRFTKKQMKECDQQGTFIAYGWTDCLNKLLEWVKAKGNER